jgi:hypothetical protein
MVIHIEGEDPMLEDDDDNDDDEHNDPDFKLDLQVKDFLEDLRKVGPFSKQILNYSYPPLLY